MPAATRNGTPASGATATSACSSATRIPEREDFYANGVTIATHEGKGRWLVDGSDDVSVAWWAPIVYPADPGPEPDDDGDED